MRFALFYNLVYNISFIVEKASTTPRNVEVVFMDKINKKSSQSSWNEYFGETMLELTETELESLEREYPLFKSQHHVKGDNNAKLPNISMTETENSFYDDYIEQVSIEIDPIQMDSNSIPSCCDKLCLHKLSLFEIHNRQQWMSNMNKREQDIAILTHLSLGISNDLESKLKRKRVRFTYRFDKKRVLCRTAFQFIFLVKESRFKRLKKLASIGILIPPLHGNTKRIPSNLLPHEDQERVTLFIQNFVEIHGLPMPGRIRNGNRETLLPSQYNYLSVWNEYKACFLSNNKETNNIRIVGYDTFRKIWQESFYNVKFQKNRSDLCDFCQEIKDRLKFCEDENETQKILQEYNDHTDIVLKARSIYNEEIDNAKSQWHLLPFEKRKEVLNNLSKYEDQKEQEPCSLKIVMHYSFDYAQKVHYPYSSQQKGKEYFITPRKCQIFGVCAEAISRQVLFLADESEVFGKGSNAVISMLDAFFRLHGLGENEAKLHADNCVGQNKNKYLMWYLMWRVMNGLHDRITISFMPPVHTKFSPDSYFGLFKIRYRKSTIDCLEDLVTCAQKTSKKGTVVPQVYGKHLGY